MNVQLPHGGRWHMLVWHVNSRQQSVALARSQRGIDRVVAAILDDWVEPDIREYRLIEIVAPSAAMERTRRALIEREHYDSFWRKIRFVARDLADRPLPPELKQCDRYEYEVEGDRDPSYAADDEEHYYCKNCYEGIAPARGSLREFYEARLGRLPPIEYACRRGVPSRARVPGDDEPLMCATNGFGVRLESVSTGDDVRMRYSPYNDGELLFVYRDLGELDKTPYVAMVAASREQDERAEAAKLAAHREKIAREDDASYQELLDLAREP